eukprot:TRINITY_DN42814_c0_g1_i1.p1 TRINITY_DN42814_c0_g1~~TRINITY_DN42814_c0_g1_i1.p1  ORF type:complete len:158 (+),score=13.60 TRINITY_DN42814_c0_g1_i1:122-595(+)
MLEEIWEMDRFRNQCSMAEEEASSPELRSEAREFRPKASGRDPRWKSLAGAIQTGACVSRKPAMGPGRIHEIRRNTTTEQPREPDGALAEATHFPWPSYRHKASHDVVLGKHFRFRRRQKRMKDRRRQTCTKLATRSYLKPLHKRRRKEQKGADKPN